MNQLKRVVFKLSGETLAPVQDADRLDRKKSPCFHPDRVNEAASMLKRIHDMGIEVAIVLGGGNIWRGRFSSEMDPVAADQMGMLASIINALCMEEALNRMGVEAITFTAQEMNRFARLYTARDADAALKRGAIVLLAGGTGNPFFTTDTGAALRAAELNADAIFKGTTVDSIYDKDPNKFADAKPLKDLTYQQALDMSIKVMDTTAFSICKDQNVKMIRVFNMDNLENIVRVASGEDLGSTVHP